MYPQLSLYLTDNLFTSVAAAAIGAGYDAHETLDEALARANSLPFGMAAYAFTTSTRTAHAISTHLEAGMVAINHVGMALAETPFGGIKDRGYGSEGGPRPLTAT